MTGAAPLALACLVAAGAGCAPAANPPPLEPPGTQSSLHALSNARFTWLGTRCVDGALDLAHAGFERELTSDLQGSTLRFRYDTTLALEACSSTQIWSLVPIAGGRWQLSPEAVVTLPPSASCGAPAQATSGVLRMTGDTLQVIETASPWCHGYDALFTYRRIAVRGPTDTELLLHWFAHWNRRDPDAVAALFAEDGVLIEPFSESQDGAPVRHEGREEVRRWLAQAFASVSWLGITPSELTSDATHTRYVAPFLYMDARLAHPVEGRNLFVVGGHEIYSAEIQLLSEPVPR